MDEPRVQFAIAADGVSIAYTVIGKGPPVLYLQPYSHQQWDWRFDEMRDWYSALAEDHTIIRYDMRNAGLSQRDAGPISRETLLLDLEAVVDRVAHDRFDIVGVSGLGLAAARYAATHPGRVNRLILWATPSNGDYFREAPRTRSLFAIVDFDESLATEIQARYIFGDDVLLTEQRVAHTNETVRPQDLANYMSALFEFDVRPDLPNVTCPTLVVYPRLHSYLTLERAQQVAASIPDCEFSIVDSGYYPYQGPDAANCVLLFKDFLSAGDEPEPPASPAPSAFQTLMFTDLESSTALTQKFGDQAAQDILHGHNDAVRKSLEEHGGREVKHTGDGIMAAFPSAVRAVEAALQIQRDLAGGEVRVRIGLNAGEPIAEDDDFFGTAVQLAARICDRADPGQVLVSRVVADLCAGKRLKFQPAGEAHMKGFDEPVALFEVSG